MYEWRGGFGSTGLRGYERFFRALPREFSDAVARAKFCKKILPGGRLFFEVPDGNDNKVCVLSSCPGHSPLIICQGLYRSPFVIAPLANHLEMIQDAIDIPGLYKTDADEYPCGAIGLAAAGVRPPLFRTSHSHRLSRHIVPPSCIPWRRSCSTIQVGSSQSSRVSTL